jgi:DHA2 family multidrug resistance protein-like MFS transporter
VGAALLLIGMGIGTVFVPSTDAVMAAVPGENAGLGSAINDSGRQVGAALGIGILGALANTGYRSGIDEAVASLSPEQAAAATRSVGAALEIAAGLGGPAGASLREAAGVALMDGFGLAMLIGAALLAAGAAAMLRWLPSHDVAAQSGEALSHPQPVGGLSPDRGRR